MSNGTDSQTESIVGGLRIIKISNYDNCNSCLNYTTYTYSKGCLLNRIETIDHMQMYNASPISDPYIGGFMAGQNHYVDVYTITQGHPHMPAFYESCNPGIVGYTYVTKFEYNGNGKLERQIVSSYSNASPLSEQGIDYYTNLFNGCMLSQEVYDGSGNLIEKTRNDHDYRIVDHYATNIIAKNKYFKGNISSTMSASYYEIPTIHDSNGFYELPRIGLPAVGPGNVYEVRRYPYILTQANIKRTIVTTKDSNGNTITKVKNFEYNEKNNQISQIEEFISKNEKDATNNISLENKKVLTKIKYAVDVLDDDNRCVYNMANTCHRLNDVVEKKTILVDNGVEHCINTQYTTRMNSHGALPISYSTSIGDNALEIQETYMYDSFSNLRSVTHDGKETLYIWSYQGEYPIAKIEGVTFDELRTVMFSKEDCPIPESDFNRMTPEIIDMTIKYMGGVEISKITAETDPKEIEKDIETIRKKVSGVGGYVTTYTYEPLVGMTSQTLPNGLTTRYLYDGFGRLMSIIDHNGKVVSVNNYNYRK